MPSPMFTNIQEQLQRTMDQINAIDALNLPTYEEVQQLHMNSIQVANKAQELREKLVGPPTA